MTKKIDMSYDNSGSFPCCAPTECHYPIGFFLGSKQVEQLGIPATVKPGDTLETVATLKITSVTSKENGTELYACISEMGIVGKDKKEPSNQLMAKAYEGGKDGNE